MKTHMETIAQCTDVRTLKEEIAVLTRDLRHYQSRLRQLQQTELAPTETEEQRIDHERALAQQCQQLMRVRRSLRTRLAQI